MVETEAIDAQWRFYIKHGKQPDEREKRRPLFKVKPNKLQRDIESGQSLIIYDQKTGVFQEACSHQTLLIIAMGIGELVMVVLRQFGDHPQLLSHLADVIKRAVQYRRSIQVSLDAGLYIESIQVILPAC